MARDLLCVRVEYYASLREEAGVSEESVETAAQNATELYDELQQRHGFTLGRSQLKFVIEW